MPEISSGDALALSVAYVGGTMAALITSFYLLRFLVRSIWSKFRRRR